MAYKHSKSFYKAVTVICIGLFLVAFKSCTNLLNKDETAPDQGFYRHGMLASMSRHLLEDTASCADVNKQHNHTMKCEFATAYCDEGDGFLNYYDFVYCKLGTLVPLAMTILILWWLFLFIGLAVTADDFFCPSLVVISETLHLSPNVAGVTFLAFGNGAPDFFSAISALSSSDGSGELGIGGLFGAGMFVTSVVVGAIAVVKPFRAMARPFLRDIIFYLVAVYWAFLMMWREKVYLVEMICYICLYVVYVIVVIVSGKIYQKQKEAKKGNAAQKSLTLTRLSGNVEAAGMHTSGLDKAISVSFSFDLDAEEEGDKSDENSASEEGKVNPGVGGGNYNPGFESSKDDLTVEFSKGGASSEGGQDNPTFDADDMKTSATNGDSFKRTSFDRKISMDISQMLDDRRPSDGVSDGSSLANGNSKHVFFTTGSQVDLVPEAADERAKRLEACIEEEEEEELEYLPQWRIFLNGINPINMEEWPDMPIYSKVYEIFKSPLMFIILLTCPVVNYEDEEMNNWNKPLNVLQCFLSPTFAVLLVQVSHTMLGGVFPVYALTLIIGVALALLVFLTSGPYEKPKYHAAFGYFGFIIALVWIYTLANEIIGLLETFGAVFGISEAILGLTLLAWGNSIGDLISNTVMARQGFARMGFAACYGAPFFNSDTRQCRDSHDVNSHTWKDGVYKDRDGVQTFLTIISDLTLGFGLAMTIKIISTGGTYAELTFTPIQLILALFLALSLLSSIIAIPLLLKFQVKRIYGAYLIGLYLVFVVVALLTETGVLLDGFTK